MKRMYVRLLLSAVFVAGMAPSEMAPSPLALASAGAPALPLSVPSALAPASPAAPENALRVDAASVDAALDQAPAAANALVTDASHPGWATRYGSEAGIQWLAPRLPTIPAATQGATPALTGTWRTSSAYPFAQNITAVAYGTDGRLFAGVANVGLRVYGPDVSGIYQWGGLPGSPASVTALAVFEGELWVGTASAGIHVYSLSTGTWFTFTVASTSGKLPSDSVNRFTAVIDPNGPDYIWISTSAGAAKYTPGRPALWDTINAVDGLPSNFVYDVAVDLGTATTWFATDGALASRTGTTITLYSSCGNSAFDYATRLLLDRQGRLWFTPVQILPGLVAQPPAGNAAGPKSPNTVVYSPIGVCVRQPAGIFVFWTLYNTLSPGLPSNIVTDLSEDYAGRIWMSTVAGGVVYDNGTWGIYTAPSKPFYNNDVDLTTVLAAGEAVWWGHASTSGASAFTIFSPNWLRIPELSLGNIPGPIFLDPTRTWAGFGSQIGWTDGTAWSSTAIPGNNSAVTAFTRGGDGKLWIGTLASGVFAYDGISTFQQYTVASGLPGNGVNALLTDHLGRVWVGTNAGLAMRAEAGYWITFTTSSSPIAANVVTALAEDGNDRIWIGTQNNGISIYNLNASGGAAWTTQTTADGLPSNAVNALASGGTGDIWAATGGGVGNWSPVSGIWAVYNTTNGALPGNLATQVVVDAKGRVWVGTNAGVAEREGNQWRPFFVPGTTIESNHILGLASDARRTWVSASGTFAFNSSIAVRGVLTSPIGSSVPAITTFSPLSSSPGDVVIINGNHFDDRGSDFDIVHFADANGVPTVPAEIISVTTTSMAVKVPALAASGKLQIEANGLKSPLSVTAFQLRPKIVSLSSNCLALGAELKVDGKGFLDGFAAAYVKIGNGAERIADATDPTEIRTFIRPGDTAGAVRIRLLNGNLDTSAQNVGIAGLQVVDSFAQQAIQGEAIIWGKRTLVQLSLVSTGCGAAQITSASLDWKFIGGAIHHGGSVTYPKGKSFGPNALPVNVNNAVSIVAELDLTDLLSQFNLPPNISTLGLFNGVSVTLRNNLVNVATVHIPPNKFNFIDMTPALWRFTFMEVTGSTADRQDANYFSTMLNNMAAAARIFPQQDAWWYGGSYGWLHDVAIFLTTDYRIKIAAKDGNQDDVRGQVDDYLDPDGREYGIAYIDQNNLTNDSGGGISSSSWDTVVAVNGTNVGGRYAVHESMHAFGFVDSDAPNYQQSNLPGQDHHSKYDEGQWNSFANCSTTRTYRQSLQDFTGGDKRIVRLDDNGAFDMLLNACGVAVGNAQSNTVKSVISYAPNRDNFNTFLEPVDYRTIIAQLCLQYVPYYPYFVSICPGFTPSLNTLAMYQPQAGGARSVGPLTATTNATRTLHLSGRIDVSGHVTPSLSYVAVNEGAVTPQQPAGDYHLIVRAANNSVLHDQSFAYESAPHALHDTALPMGAGSLSAHASSPHQPVDSDPPADVSLFNLRVPFPVNAVSAEIQHNGVVLWSKSVSAHAPTVNFSGPNGGTFNATDTVTVTWTASDLDGDILQFGLDYSPDNGASWMLVAPKIIGNGFAWVPAFLPGSNTARLRLRVSDGFNTGNALSAPFVLHAHAPVAAILAPGEGQILTEGAVIQLQGNSMTANGIGDGAFKWMQGAATLGLTRTVPVTLSAVGVQTLTLQVTSNSLTGTSSVHVTVVPDYDHDGLPNAYEAQHQLNPLDPSDATADMDGDGLSNLDEFHFGTDPRNADTDGDGVNDSAEITASTDPLNPLSKPLATPVLTVGSSSMGFTVNSYTPLPGPKSAWVTNVGSGVLNFTANGDAPWLVVSPSSSAAPQQLTVGYNLNGLTPGTYQGHVTVTAPGVSGGPQTISVTLNYQSPPAWSLFAPIVSR